MELVAVTKSALRGFGLVELMIAMLLSVLLGAAVIQAYLGSKNSFALRDAHSEVLENGRFAINHIVENIQSAGAAGCNNIDSLTYPASRTNTTPEPAPGSEANYRSVVDTGGGATTNGGLSTGIVYSPDSIIRGFDNIAAGNAFGPAKVNSDVLIIRRLSNEAAQLAVSMTSSSSDIVITAGVINPGKGDPVLIGDCNRAILFRVSDDPITAGGKITLKHGTAGSYNTRSDFPSLDGVTDTYFTLPSATAGAYGGGQVMTFDSITYSIRDTGRTTKKGLPIFGLFESRVGSGGSLASTELVSGVEDMQLEYGLKDYGAMPGKVTSYVTANNVPDWARVVSVRINLLLQSTSDSVVGSSAADKQAQTLVFPLVSTVTNGPGAPAQVVYDGRLRHAIFSIATIRNRAQLAGS